MARFDAADVTDGVLMSRCPERQSGRLRQTTDHVRIDCFLKHYEVRRGISYYFSQVFFSAAPAKANVVAEQLNNHEAFCASITMQ